MVAPYTRAPQKDARVWVAHLILSFLGTKATIEREH